jgi:hypothetical protein
MDFEEIGLEVVDWISMASGYGERAGCDEHGNETGSHKTQRISGPAEELLACRKWLYSLKLII